MITETSLCMLNMLCMGGRSHGRPLVRPSLAAVLMACLALDATAFAWSPQVASGPRATVCLGSQLCRSGLHSYGTCAWTRPHGRGAPRDAGVVACVQSFGDAFASPVGARAPRPPLCRRASLVTPGSLHVRA
jgi:hypothetical protein